MPTVIKNIHLIDSMLTPENREKLEVGASLHKRHARLEFKIVSFKNNTITIQAAQGKSPAGNYLPINEIVSRAKDMLTPFVPDGTIIHVHPIPYQDHHISLISDAWIRKQMLDKGLKAKQIANDTAIEYKSIVNWLNGKKPMSDIVKAMFYYYFNSK